MGGRQCSKSEGRAGTGNSGSTEAMEKCGKRQKFPLVQTVGKALEVGVSYRRTDLEVGSRSWSRGQGALAGANGQREVRKEELE